MNIYEIKVVSDKPMQVGECPLWHPKEAALYWVDIDGRAVHRLHPATGSHQQWPMASEPSALAISSEIKRNQIGERILGLPRDPLIN